MTEDIAKTKICPFVEDMGNCITSDCMAWIKTSEERIKNTYSCLCDKDPITRYDEYCSSCRTFSKKKGSKKVKENEGYCVKVKEK